MAITSKNAAITVDSENNVVMMRDYYPEGGVFEEYQYDEESGRRTGPVTRYYEIDEDDSDEEDSDVSRVWERGFYDKDGKESGIWVGFWKYEGTIGVIGKHEKGKRQGFWLTYGEDGEFEQWEVYDEGRVVEHSTEIYDYFLFIAEEMDDLPLFDDDGDIVLEIEMKIIAIFDKNITELAEGAGVERHMLYNGFEKYYNA